MERITQTKHKRTRYNSVELSENFSSLGNLEEEKETRDFTEREASFRVSDSVRTREAWKGQSAVESHRRLLKKRKKMSNWT